MAHRENSPPRANPHSQLWQKEVVQFFVPFNSNTNVCIVLCVCNFALIFFQKRNLHTEKQTVVRKEVCTTCTSVSCTMLFATDVLWSSLSFFSTMLRSRFAMLFIPGLCAYFYRSLPPPVKFFKIF